MTTFIVGVVVFALVVLAGRSIYKNAKKGSCASCGCGGCAKCAEEKRSLNR